MHVALHLVAGVVEAGAACLHSAFVTTRLPLPSTPNASLTPWAAIVAPTTSATEGERSLPPGVTRGSCYMWLGWSVGCWGGPLRGRQPGRPADASRGVPWPPAKVHKLSYIYTRSGIMGFVRELFSFPNPVNEKAARVVAGVVLVTVAVVLATGTYWLLIPLAYGFWARVLTGPTLSPLGWVAQRVIAPRLGASKPVPGPPKRFAQAMGAVMSSSALVLALVVGSHTAADAVLIAIAAAAGLESIFAYCVGCKVFALLMRVGVIPASVCAECADVGWRLSAAR